MHKRSLVYTQEILLCIHNKCINVTCVAMLRSYAKLCKTRPGPGPSLLTQAWGCCITGGAPWWYPFENFGCTGPFFGNTIGNSIGNTIGNKQFNRQFIELSIGPHWLQCWSSGVSSGTAQELAEAAYDGLGWVLGRAGWVLGPQGILCMHKNLGPHNLISSRSVLVLSCSRNFGRLNN